MRVLTGLSILSTASAMMETPVQKVVGLLKEMMTQLENEKKADEKMFKDLDCWCKTNKEQKTQENQDAQDELENLNASIKNMGGKMKSTMAKMGEADTRIGELEGIIEEAKTNHAKNLGLLRTDESELAKATKSLQMALTVLRKEAGGFIQTTPEAKVALSTLIHSAARKAEILFGLSFGTSFLQASTQAETALMESMNSSYQPQMDADMAEQVLNVFMQKASSKATQIPTEYKAIFEQLGKIEQNFQKDLEAKRDEIKQTVAVFEDSKKALNEQLKATQDSLTQLKKENADATAKFNEDKHTREKARETISATTTFLENLKTTCADINSQWTKREAERSNEIQAVQEAINILTDDDNREKLVKGMAVSFIQMNSLMSHSQATRIRVVDLLQKAARRSPDNAALSQLAASAKLDAFVKVKKAIDDMMAQIEKQIGEEVQTKHDCTKKFKKNDRQQEKNTMKLQAIGFAMEDLKTSISQKEETIAKAQEAIANTKTSMLQAGQDREEENTVFQQMVLEQRETVKILQQAEAKLKSYYDKPVATLVQESSDDMESLAQQTPPGSFKDYTKNTGSNSVLTLLGKIISEAQDLVATGKADELSGQQSYETLIMDSNAAIEAENGKIVGLQSAIADDQESYQTSRGDQRLKEKRATFLTSTRKNLHEECDFLVTNFDVRQTAQKSEVEALRQAKAILSGMA